MNGFVRGGKVKGFRFISD